MSIITTNMTIPKINNTLTAPEYFAYSGLSKTQLGYLKQSPSHLRNYLDTPHNPATPDQKFGSAVHTACLEPETFGERYCVAPVCDRRTTIGKAAYAEFLAANVGKDAIDAEDYQTVLNIAAAFRACPALQQYGIGEGDGVAEASVFAVDGGTNLSIKARLDYYHPATNTIIDIKTTKSADFWSFRREIFKYAYALQSCHYRDIVEQITGRPARFIFVAIEKESPHGIQLFELDEESHLKADTERRELIRGWAKALSTNTFNSYPSEVASVSLK
jgi:hypothetical protein